jgi:uncharacterized protein
MASNRLHMFRINARELLRQPGLDKQISVALPASDFGVGDERITGDVVVDLQAVSGVDGITLSGTITMPWATACRRCLAEVTGVARIDVDETYRDDVGPDDAFDVEGAFEIERDQIDLVPAIREYLLIELPDDQLCRDDCAGLCPVCGTDRNTHSCDCDTTTRDERWAVLDELRLDDD